MLISMLRVNCQQMPIPEGFSEDPFAYPAMSCPICGFRFVFKDPFQEFNRFLCPKCDSEVDIPDQIVEVFIENMDFMDYLKRRRAPPGMRPPPIFN